MNPKDTRQRVIERWLSRLHIASGGRMNLRCLEVGRARRWKDTTAHSTLKIAAHPAVGLLTSIDKSPATERLCRELLGELADKVTFLNGHSARLLQLLHGRSDRMYDFAYIDGASDPAVAHDDLKAALRLCRTGAFILLDNIDGRYDTKGKINVPWCRRHKELVDIVETVPSDSTCHGVLVVRVKPTTLVGDRRRAPTLRAVRPLLRGMTRLLHIGEQFRKGWEFWPEWFRRQGIQDIDVLEVYPPNVKLLRIFGGWRHVYEGDVRTAHDVPADAHVDAAFWWHGPEHVAKAEFQGCIDNVLAGWQPKLIILGMPYGRHPNRKHHFANQAAFHVSTWYPPDLEALGWHCVALEPRDRPGGHITAWREFPR